ncbi:MAG: T9SS type A sorting domain-containing protein [Bacteroidota bacterium]
MIKSLTKLVAWTALLSSLGYASQGFSQSLNINFFNGEIEEYPLAEVQSVKFELNSMIINQTNGEAITINIDQIFYYDFDITNLNTTWYAEKQNVLQIFPNPSSSSVNIEYLSTKTGQTLIEILDNSGRVIEVLFNGLHSENTRVVWEVSEKSISPGAYICRVSCPWNVTLRKVIIQ